MAPCPDEATEPVVVGAFGQRMKTAVVSVLLFSSEGICIPHKRSFDFVFTV